MKPNISFVPGSLTIVKFKVSGFGLTIPNANAGTEVSLKKSDQIKHLLIDHFLDVPFVHITSLLNICCRVCKRWKRLSTDKSLWSEVNLQIFGGLTGGKVKKKLQTYCDASWTKKLSISARSRRRNALNEWDAKSMIWTWWDEEARKRKLATKSICMYT